MMVAFLHHALLEIKTMPVVFSELCLSPCLPHLWCKCNYNSTRLISQCVFIFQKCCFRVYLNSISTIIRRENNNNKSIPILHDTCQLVGHKNGKRQKHVGCTVLKKKKVFQKYLHSTTVFPTLSSFKNLIQAKTVSWTFTLYISHIIFTFFENRSHRASLGYTIIELCCWRATFYIRQTFSYILNIESKETQYKRPGTCVESYSNTTPTPCDIKDTCSARVTALRSISY